MSEYYPELIQIETTTACNAKCPMCPRNIQKRGHGRMDDAMLYSVVGQAYDLGVRFMLPFIDGEPLADPRMVQFVGFLSKTYPDVVVGWYTNGSLLTEEKARQLLGFGNIKQFNVSMQGGTKEVYEANMGLPWERSIANVEMLLRVNEELGNPSEIRLNMCVFSKTSKTLDDFKRRWEGRATVCPGAFSNFGGMVRDDEGEEPWKDKPRLVCDRATKHIYVYWNCDVGQCCFDLLGSVTHGNLSQNSLREILDGPSHRLMREAHRALNVSGMPPICHDCNSCKFHG